MTSEAGWTVLIPVKRLDRAKTRLRDPHRGESDQKPSSEFARAFARDVILASLNAETATSVVVIGSDADILDASMSSAQFVEEDCGTVGGGLNAALTDGIAHIRKRDRVADIIVLTGDLAAVRARSIDALTRAAPVQSASYVADHQEIGTAALLIPRGITITPRFGDNSASEHASIGCAPLTDFASPDIRMDIDTMSDLQVAIELGVGTHTQAALARLAAPVTS